MNKILFKLIEGKGKFFLNGDLVNGEIVNPEDIGKISLDYHNHVFYLDGKQIKDGDTFDLTEGMGFEEVTTCKWGGDRNACGNETCWDLNECQNSPEVKYIRLLPEKQVQKEESQEELLTEFIQKLLLRTSIEELKKEFTIKRKES